MTEAAQEQKAQQRPLSPHLQIYKPQITSATSIFHRVTGAILMGGLLLVTWGLVALATGEESFNGFLECAGSIFGRIVIFGWSLAFFYHLCSGIRHLIMDTGRLFEMEQAYKAAYTVYAMTLILTIASWVCFFAVLGGE
jgi:succinate dehydrogenase / fumarate reductase cytochrome b subunit